MGVGVSITGNRYIAYDGLITYMNENYQGLAGKTVEIEFDGIPK
jgi:hypothetical protein